MLDFSSEHTSLPWKLRYCHNEVYGLASGRFKVTKFKNKITKTMKTGIMYGKYNQRNFKSMPSTSMVGHFLSFKIKAFIFEQNIPKLTPCGMPAAALKLLLLLSPLKLYTTVTTYSSSSRAVGKLKNMWGRERGGRGVLSVIQGLCET